MRIGSEPMRALRATAVAAWLTTVACVPHPPASFDPRQISDLPCRQMVSSSTQPVVWMSPPGRNDQWRLSRWCETVGGVVFRAQPAQAPDGPIDRLAIVSWNVHEANGDVDALVTRLRRGDFTGGEPIDHFVLLLQEVVRRDRTVPARVPSGAPVTRSIVARRDGEAGVSRVADSGFAVLYAPSMRNGNGGDERAEIAARIVSTLPLGDARLIELPLEHQRRVAASAAVDGGPAAAPVAPRALDVHSLTALALLHRGPFAARRRQALSLLDALARTDPRRTAVRGAGRRSEYLDGRPRAGGPRVGRCVSERQPRRAPTCSADRSAFTRRSIASLSRAPSPRRRSSVCPTDLARTISAPHHRPLPTALESAVAAVYSPARAGCAADVFIAFLLRVGIDPWLGKSVPFILFFRRSWWRRVARLRRACS